MATPITPPIYPTPLDDAVAQLTSPHSIGQTTLTVNNASVFGSPSTNSPLRLTVVRATDKVRCHFKVVSISGNVLTLAGVMDGYSDTAFAVGDKVGVLVSAGTILDLQDTDLVIIDKVNELCEEGVQGPQGSAGPQGNTGATGNQGSQGHQGAQGATGVGTQGVAGLQGSVGSQGSTGSQGATGVGVQGATGAQGAKGDQGSTGSQGSTGAGTQGNQGLQGSQGNQGNQGTTGVGTQGPQGRQGFQGTQGTTGVGSQGNQGFQGTTGVGTQGNQGVAGVGTQGNQGTQGTQGTQGPQGRQGFQGVTGAGTQGNQGFQGNQGSTGVGTQGNQGVTGAGTQGNQGSQGSQGSAGSGTPAGSTGNLQYNNAGSFGGAQYLNYASSGTLLTATAPAKTDKALVLKTASGAAYTDTHVMEVQDSTGTTGTFFYASGALAVVGAFDQDTTIAGVHIGQPAPAPDGSPRVLFCDGAAYLNWQIDNDKGLFRWFTPGVLHMSLDVTNGLNLVHGCQAASFTGVGTALTALNASNLASGTVNTARLGSGTASSSTFLRGDGTWASGGGGAQGNQGFQGNQGTQGNQGVAGTGSQGNQGFQGNQGTQGNQGVAGTGTQGHQGFQGTSGSQGNQGFQGSTGTGSQGNQGATGPQGGGSTPGGSSGQIQINSSGSLAGLSTILAGTNPILATTNAVTNTTNPVKHINCVDANGNDVFTVYEWFGDAVPGQNCAWLNMGTGGPSGIGSGGPGTTTWIAYAGSSGEWYSNAQQGDICYRNIGHALLLGNSDQKATLHVVDNRVWIDAQGTTSVPLTITAASGQSADLQEWQDSSGTTLASVNSGGKIVATNGLQVIPGAQSGYFLKSDGSGNATWSAGGAGAQGNQGFQGFQGTTGAGSQGNQGFQGSSGGAQGNQGFQGGSGSQGNQGNQGFQGSSGGGGGVTSTTASGTVTLTGSSNTIQFIDVNGANRDCGLPSSPATALTFTVKNTATSGAFVITVKNSGGTQVGPTIPWGASLTVVFDGTIWQVI